MRRPGKTPRIKLVGTKHQLLADLRSQVSGGGQIFFDHRIPKK